VSDIAAPYHHRQLADALVEAATRLIAERRTTEVSLREVAESVGVSHTAAYRHFPSKIDLLARIAVAGFHRLTEALKEAAEGHAAGAQRLAALGRAHIDFAVAHAGTYRTMFHPGLCATKDQTSLNQAGAEALALIRSAVAQGQAERFLRTDIDPDVMAASLWAAQHGYACLLIDGVLSDSSAIGHAPLLGRQAYIDLIVSALTPT
jgi:AcrR family transcriptional regulator